MTAKTLSTDFQKDIKNSGQHTALMETRMEAGTTVLDTHETDQEALQGEIVSLHSQRIELGDVTFAFRGSQRVLEIFRAQPWPFCRN